MRKRSLDECIEDLQRLMQFPQRNLPSHLRCVEVADLSDILDELRMSAARQGQSPRPKKGSSA